VATGTTEETRREREERKVHLHPRAPLALLSSNATDPRVAPQREGEEEEWGQLRIRGASPHG